MHAMSKLKSLTLALLAAAGLQAAAPAFASVVVDPTSDGSLYTCAGCNAVADGQYVLASGTIRGDVKFAMSALPAQLIATPAAVPEPGGTALTPPGLLLLGVAALRRQRVR